jgi:hypothetical protein
MKKIAVLLFLTQAIIGSAVTQLPTQTATPAQTLSPSSSPEATPTPALGDDVGQILSDGHVVFRLLAPNAQSVSITVVTNGGEVTTEMTQELFGLWTATLGPFKPDLYEYSFMLDGVRIADPGSATPKPQWQVNTSLLLVPGTPLISWTHKMSRMELFAKRPTTRLRLANIAGCWSIPRPIMTVLLTLPFLSFTFTMAAGIRATRG